MGVNLIGCIFLLLVFGQVNGGSIVNKHIVDLINELDTSFTARHYPEFDQLTPQQFKQQFGFVSNNHKKAINKNEPLKQRNEDEPFESIDSVTDFDVSQKWPQCESVFNEIQKQSNCVAGWAVAVTSAIRDRRCIQYGRIEPISAWDLLSCCDNCKNDAENGCNGGSHHSALSFYQSQGIVTGGSFQSGSGCKPYALNPNLQSKPGNTTCYRNCQENYNKNYQSDKIYGNGHADLSNNEKEIMNEILTNGPVVAQLDLYDDFIYYSSGVYKHELGSLNGTHHVKIVGWGTDKKGSKFWRAANSYGTKWGEDGFIRIKRKKNGINFESNVLAGQNSDWEPPKQTSTTTPQSTIKTPTPSTTRIQSTTSTWNSLSTTTFGGPSYTCQNIVGYYFGTFQDPNHRSWTFDAQFQFKANANLNDQKIYFGVDHWNKNSNFDYIGITYYSDTWHKDCYLGQNCSITFPNSPDLNIIHICKNGDCFDILDFENFEDSFTLKNTVGKCTKHQPLHHPYVNWDTDPSLYSYCVCCDEYNPHPSLNCPPNPWQGL